MLAAMANRTPQVITRAGVIPTYNAAASGDTVTPGEQVFLHVKNAAGSSATLTITAVGGEGGLPLGNLAVVVAVGESVIGPIVPELFANVSDGLAHMAWSSVTSVTWAALTY